MKVLTKALIIKSEENAVNSGIFSYKDLMYTAGKTAGEIILEKIDCRNKKIAVICGNGNNGGDGFVVAEFLYEHGADISVFTPFGKPKTETASHFYNFLSTDIKQSASLNDSYDIIIDAVFGIGLNRELSENANSLFNQINSINCTKIAIDIPSGIETDSGKVLGTAFKADFTITFIALKPCFLLPEGSDYCGEVFVADIGVTPCGYTFNTIEKPIFQKRRHNSHKGDYGTALLLCGSYGMAGAAILATKAALRSGLGIAKCVIDQRIYQAFTCSIPEAICQPVTDSDNINILNLTEKCDALLFGCGSPQNEKSKAILENIINFCEIPIVLDAGGINMLSHSIKLLKKSKAPIIITPHPAEMARLCNLSVAQIEQNRVEISRNFSKEFGCIVVLKGANTIVAEPNGNISFNITGNPGMATGGSGDVLSGIIVSLLAQGLSPLDAAKAAVFLHGNAANKAAALRSRHALLPTDIINEL